jgi:hypothetical protein
MVRTPGVADVTGLPIVRVFAVQRTPFRRRTVARQRMGPLPCPHVAHIAEWQAFEIARKNTSPRLFLGRGDAYTFT